MLVPIERWDSMARNALHAATRLSPDVVALHLVDLQGPDAQDREARLREDWAGFVEGPATAVGLRPPQLLVERTPYRSIMAPLLREIQELRRQKADRPVIVVLNELSGVRWWRAVLHTRRTQRLRTRLLRYAGANVSVLVLPWQLEAPETERMMAEEEPQLS